MKTAGGMVADWATSSAPFEFPGGSGCQRSSLSLVFCFFLQKIWVAVLRVPRAVATRAKRRLDGGTLADAARSSTAGHVGQAGVAAAATHLDRLVGEGERRVKEVDIGGGCVAFEKKIEQVQTTEGSTKDYL